MNGSTATANSNPRGSLGATGATSIATSSTSTSSAANNKTSSSSGVVNRGLSSIGGCNNSTFCGMEGLQQLPGLFGTGVTMAPPLVLQFPGQFMGPELDSQLLAQPHREAQEASPDLFQFLNVFMGSQGGFGTDALFGGAAAIETATAAAAATIPTTAAQPQVHMADILSQPYTMVQAMVPLAFPAEVTLTENTDSDSSNHRRHRHHHHHHHHHRYDSNHHHYHRRKEARDEATATANNNENKNSSNNNGSGGGSTQHDLADSELLPPLPVQALVSTKEEGKKMDVPALGSKTVCPTCSATFADYKNAVFCNGCLKWVHKKCCRRHFAEEEGNGNDNSSSEAITTNDENEEEEVKGRRRQWQGGGGAGRGKGRKRVVTRKRRTSATAEGERRGRGGLSKKRTSRGSRLSLKRKHRNDSSDDENDDDSNTSNSKAARRRRRCPSGSRSASNRTRYRRRRRGGQGGRWLSWRNRGGNSGGGSCGAEGGGGGVGGVYTDSNDTDDEYFVETTSGMTSESEGEGTRPGSPRRPMLSPLLSSSASPSPLLCSVSPDFLGAGGILNPSSGNSGNGCGNGSSGGGGGGLHSVGGSSSSVNGGESRLCSSNGSGPNNNSGGGEGLEGTAVTFNAVDISTLECEICAICGTSGTLYRDIVSCVDCGQSFHAECIRYNGPLSYGCTWRCPECAVCEKCGKHCTQTDSVACSICARLYHIWCIGTTSSSSSAGGIGSVPWYWECEACKMRSYLQRSRRNRGGDGPVGTPPVAPSGEGSSSNSSSPNELEECNEDGGSEEAMPVEVEEFEECPMDAPFPGDARVCAICGEKEGAEDNLLPVECDVWVHVQCALLSTGVTVSDTNKILGLQEVLAESKTAKCALCGKVGGATVSCTATTSGKCPVRYHPKCAMASGGVMLANKTRWRRTSYAFLCQAHKAQQAAVLTPLEPVTIPEPLCRARGAPKVVVKHKKSTRRFPARLGNLSVTSLGFNLRRLVKHGSTGNGNSNGSNTNCCGYGGSDDVRNHATYRAGWKSMLLFWDYKRPKEKCLYRCEIVQNSEINTKDTMYKNFAARVTAVRGGADGEAFVAPSTSEVWCKIVELINDARGQERIHFKGGDYYFGLTSPLVYEVVKKQQ